MTSLHHENKGGFPWHPYPVLVVVVLLICPHHKRLVWMDEIKDELTGTDQKDV